MELVGSTFFFPWEVSFMVFLQRYMNGFLILLASIFTEIGDVLIVVAVAIVSYVCFDKEFGKRVCCNAILGTVANCMIKNVLLRRRPYFDNKEIKCLKPLDKDADIMDIEAQGFSFPSGHSTNAVSVFGTIFQYNRNKLIRIGCIVVILLIGLSRSALGVHYPTDVIVGWLMGILGILVIPKLEEKLSRRTFYIIAILAGAIGLFYCDSNDFFDAYGVQTGFMLGVLFEEKYVNFEVKRDIRTAAIKIVYLLSVFLTIAKGLEFICPASLLQDRTFEELFRSFRYACASFMVFGICPKLFKKIDALKV